MKQYPQHPQFDMGGLQDFFQQSSIWLILALLLVAVTLVRSVRIGEVTGEEVGILLSKITGKLEVVEESGKHIYNGITHEFFVLDRTLQTLEMTETEGRGDRAGKDDLKIKTVDGSDVFIDLKVQYRIIPSAADLVITTSGPGENYKKQWARDYVRSLSRDSLGELKTEEFYDSTKREEKLLLAKAEANERLEKRFGIYIDSISIPKEPHFYEDYEAIVKEKKLADQTVLEEESKADAAKQRQETSMIEETNRKNVAVEEFTGTMEQKRIEAEAEARKIEQEADAYYDTVTIGAEARLYARGKEAEGTLEMKTKEAEGIRELRMALEEKGGRNMVKLEYAGKLKDVIITGQPFSRSGETDRVQHLYEYEKAARTGRNAPKSVKGRTQR